MTDFKISKKQHPTGSLSRRILIVAILLLVIPLFFHSFFLYRQEYQITLEEWREDLNVVAKERGHLIKEKVQLSWALLDAYAASSDPVAPPQIEKIPTPHNVADHFVLVSKNSHSIIVGRKCSETLSYVIFIPFSDIGKEIPFTHPVRIALLNAQGKIIWQNFKWKEDADILQVKEPIPQTDVFLQLSLDKRDIQGLHLDTYYFRFASLVFFVGFLGGIAVYFFTKRISKPLTDLGRTMKRVSEGAAHARYTPDRMGFEINQIGLQFNETLDSLLQHQEEAEKERLHREKLAEELRIGHQIQSSLSPTHIPGLPNLDIATGYFAAKEVNGDFYDLYHLEDDKLLLAVCDTAGKGISACLFSLGLRSMIRAIASVTTDLSELIRQVNDLYYLDAHESSMFSTLWLGIYDPKTHRLTYCSQGHPPAFLLRKGKIEELWTDGIALGAQKIDEFSVKEIILQRNDFLLLYTDGVIEAHNIDNELFGRQRLHQFLFENQGHTAQHVADLLIEEVRQFSGSAPMHDDMTFIAMQIR